MALEPYPLPGCGFFVCCRFWKTDFQKKMKPNRFARSVASRLPSAVTKAQEKAIATLTLDAKMQQAKLSNREAENVAIREQLASQSERLRHLEMALAELAYNSASEQQVRFDK